MPAVSVIIPNYNHAKYLTQRIESVLNQTFKDIELIILDDCSTDESMQVIDQYRNNKLVYNILANSSNSGSPFVQWKKGIESANGKYIWIAESDDYSESTFLESCIIKLEEDPSISLAFCHTVPISNSDSIIPYKEIDQEGGKHHAIKELFFYNWYFRNVPFRIPNASSCVFRKDLVDSISLEEITKYKYGGDKYLWFSILSKHPEFYFIDKSLNYQRTHENTTRAKKGIKPEYKRSQELTSIYEKYKSQKLPVDGIANKEIGFRMLGKNIYGIFVGKCPNITQLIKSMWWVGFDIKIYKKFLRTIFR